MPMGLQTDGIAIARLCEIAELAGPVDVAFTGRRPDHLAVRPFDSVLHVTMVDTVFGKKIPRYRIGIELAPHNRISGVPVQGEMW